jgi:hypothetical protein
MSSRRNDLAPFLVSFIGAAPSQYIATNSPRLLKNWRKCRHLAAAAAAAGAHPRPDADHPAGPGARPGAGRRIQGSGIEGSAAA